MPRPSQNPLDGIADELFGWMDSEVSYYVDALKGGPNGRAPFAANASEAERHDYFTRKMFVQDPDGTTHYDQPNAEGRAELMSQLGPQQYAETYDLVKPKEGRRPELEPEDDLDEDSDEGLE